MNPPPTPSTPDVPAPSRGASVPTQHARPRIRWVWLVAGFLCVALGALGAVLPLLPTTPLILLAAACFARGDERFLHWLLEHRLFGPTLRTWRARHALPPGVKSKAIALVVLTIGLSAWMLTSPVGRWTALAVGAGLVVFLARLPVYDEEIRD